jgi:hypothetical protein
LSGTCLLQYFSKNEQKFDTWSLYHGISAATIALNKSEKSFLIPDSCCILVRSTRVLEHCGFFFCMKSNSGVLFQLRLHSTYYVLVTHKLQLCHWLKRHHLSPTMIPILIQEKKQREPSRKQRTVSFTSMGWRYRSTIKNLTTAHKELNFIPQNPVGWNSSGVGCGV